MLILRGSPQPAVAVDATVFGPTSFAGHDLIAIDGRGAGRSDGVSSCPELHDYNAEENTFQLSAAAIAAFKACITKAEAASVPLASILDHSVLAADVAAIRHSLGIDKWMMYTTIGSAGAGLYILKVDGAAVTAVMARDPLAVGFGLTPSTIADTFDRYAADCAKSPNAQRTVISRCCWRRAWNGSRRP